DHWMTDAIAVSAHAGHAVQPGSWHHVAMSISRGAAVGQIFLDGVLEGQTNWDPNQGARPYGAETWKIGAVTLNQKQFWQFKGAIDDVRFYARTITPGEAAVLAEVPLKKVLTPEPPVTVKFVGVDDKTRGNWRGVYGSEGIFAYNEYPWLPPYAHVFCNG